MDNQRVLFDSVTGSELRSKRLALGMTQEVMAKELGVTANTVARWERGEVPKNGKLPAWVEKLVVRIERDFSGNSESRKGSKS